jgi:hypothetical protein
MAMSIFTVVFIVSCVDLSVQPIPNSIDYSSQIKIVNLVSGAGTATLTMNGQSLGTVDFGSETPGSFLTIPSGSKTLNASFASAASSDYQFAAATDYKFRVFMWGTAATNDVTLYYQRYIWQTPGSANGDALFPANMGQVAFFNGSADAVILSVTLTGPDTTTVDFEATTAIESGVGSPYTELTSGSYSISIVYSDLEGVTDTLPTFDYTLESKGRYTAVIYDEVASIKNAVFIDD